MRRIVAVLTIWGAVVVAGCGAAMIPDYPNRLVGADGRQFTLEDVSEIVGAPAADLGEDDKRDQLRDLGIEDEELIDALLDL